MNEQPNRYWRAKTRPITIAVLFLYLLECLLIVTSVLPAWTALVVILAGFPVRWLVYRVWGR